MSLFDIVSRCILVTCPVVHLSCIPGCGQLTVPIYVNTRKILVIVFLLREGSEDPWCLFAAETRQDQAGLSGRGGNVWKTPSVTFRLRLYSEHFYNMCSKRNA